MNDFKGRSYVNNHSKSDKIKRLLWEFIRLLVFRPTPRWALNKWRLFLLTIFGAKIGIGVRILPTCKIWAPWNLSIGEYSVLGDDVDCYNVDKIIIGKRVTISQRTFLCTASHNITSLRLPLIHKPIIIKDFAWVCSECFIHPGTTVQEGSVVAARSVLIKDTDCWSIYAGNPAVKIKKRIVKEKV